MRRSIVFQTLGLAGLLAALPALSLLADDLHTAAQPQPPHMWGAGTFDSSVAAGNTVGTPVAINTGDITYLTGGIGNEEREVMEAVKNNYDLHVTATDASGNFEGDSRVVIRDRSGNPLLDVSAGPIFYANLPHGTYTIEISTASGTAHRETVTVGGPKPAFIYFRE